MNRNMVGDIFGISSIKITHLIDPIPLTNMAARNRQFLFVSGWSISKHLLFWNRLANKAKFYQKYLWRVLYKISSFHPDWTKETTTYDAWDRHKNVARLNRLIGSQSSPLDNWISNGNKYINKGLKTWTDLLSLKKTTYYHKDEWQHIYEQYNSRITDQWMLVGDWPIASKIDYVG